MNNESESIDPVLKAMFDDLRQAPARDPLAAASGKARYLAEVDSLLAEPQFAKQPGARQRFSQQFNMFKGSFSQRAALTAIVAVVAILVFLFGGASMTAYAAQSALPGDALYPVKTQLERTQASLSGDATREAQLYLRYAQRRLDEIASLIEQGRFDDISQATNEFQAHIHKALSALQKVAAQDPQKAAQLAAEVTSQLTRYSQVLGGMLTGVPASVQEQLQRAIQASQDGSRLETQPNGEIEIIGVIEEIGDGWMRVNGRVILITPETVINGELAVGGLVKVHLVLAAGELAASQVDPAESPAANDNGDGNENDNANGNDNGNANGNDNGNANGNDNGNANGNSDDNSNDNGEDNGNDNGDDNSNDNGDDNSNDNGDDNSNDNGDDNSNDNGDDNSNDDSNGNDNGNDNGDDSGNGGDDNDDNHNSNDND